MSKKSEPVKQGKLNEVLIIESRRPNGTLRVQQDFEFCPTMAEQHTAHLTDVNYLMTKMRPDELSAYIAQKTLHRREITGHDFSREPDLQGAMNINVQLRQNFESLDEEVRRNFRNHVEFLKFIDNPANQAKMIKLGLMTKKEVDANTTPTTTTTQEAKETKESSTQPS